MELRLIYFDFPFWRAEVSRLALHLSGIPFEDIRPSRAEFMAMKNSGELPYGQLPVLDVDGVRIAQSVAIARLCGQVSGLYPKDDLLDQARVDELLDTCTQLSNILGSSMSIKDTEEKMRARHKLGTKVLPKWLGFIEKRLNANPTSDYFVGDQLSVADLAIWRILGWLTGGILDGIPTNLLEAHPQLKSHYQRIDQLEGVRSWMARYA